MKEWILKKRWRVVLSGLLIVAVPLLSLSAFVHFQVTDALKERIIKENKVLAKTTAHSLEERLRSDMELGRSYATRPYLLEGVKRGDKKEMDKHLKILVENSHAIERAFITDPKGIQFANYPETPETIGKDFSDRDWYKGVSKNWTPYVSEAYMRMAQPRRYLFAIAVPMSFEENIIGILVMQPGENYIKNAIGRVDIGRRQIYVADKKGALIYHSQYTIDRVINFSHVPAVQKVIKGLEGIERTLDLQTKEPVIAAYYPLSEWGWGVVVEKPENIALAPLKKITFYLAAVTGLMLFLGGFFAYRGAELLISTQRLAKELKDKEGFEKIYTEFLTLLNSQFSSVGELCNASLRKLSENACMDAGVFYVLEDGKLKSYSTVAVQAPSMIDNLSTECIIQKKILRLKDIPSDTYLKVETGIGTFIPKDIIAVPLLYKDEPVAVLELASIQGLEEINIKNIERIAGQLASGISTIKSNLAQKALLKERDRVFNLSIDMLSITGFDGYFKQLNPAWKTTLGWTGEELMSKPCLEFVHPGDRESTINAAGALSDGQTLTTFENRYLCKDGSYKWISWSCSPLVEEKLIFSVTRDVTERKKLEQDIMERSAQLKDANLELQAMNEELQAQQKELSEANLRLAEASKTKSDFLANMSHELRTPLNSILGFSEIMQDELFGKLNEKQQEYVKDIYSSGKHLLNLINDILDLSKVESGKMELELSHFPLSDVLNASLTMLKEKAIKHHIQLSLEIEPDADKEIEADERKLKQILFNLLSNAVKFTPAGGSVSARARKASLRGEAEAISKDETPHSARNDILGDDFVEIIVSDTGVGIKAEDLPKLFEEFTQLESPYTKHHEGTGLGLALTKKLVELHRGRIWVESEFGKGSRFAFAMPVKQPMKSGTISGAQMRHEGIAAAGKHALVIDDDPKTLEIVSRALTAEGYRVTHASSGMEGVETAKGDLPDLIVLDLMMSDISGFDVADILYSDKRTSGIPIIVLTAMDLSPEGKGRLEGKVRYIAEKGSLTREGFINEIKKIRGA